MARDRRLSQRVPVELEATLALNGRIISARVEDISYGGARFSVIHTGIVSPGRRVQAVIEAERPIKVVGRIVWARKEKDKLSFGADLYPKTVEDQQRLRELLFRLLSLQKEA